MRVWIRTSIGVDGGIVGRLVGTVGVNGAVRIGVVIGGTVGMVGAVGMVGLGGMVGAVGMGGMGGMGGRVGTIGTVGVHGIIIVRGVSGIVSSVVLIVGRSNRNNIDMKRLEQSVVVFFVGSWVKSGPNSLPG